MYGQSKRTPHRNPPPGGPLQFCRACQVGRLRSWRAGRPSWRAFVTICRQIASREPFRDPMCGHIRRRGPRFASRPSPRSQPHRRRELPVFVKASVMYGHGNRTPNRNPPPGGPLQFCRACQEGRLRSGPAEPPSWRALVTMCRHIASRAPLRDPMCRHIRHSRGREAAATYVRPRLSDPPPRPPARGTPPVLQGLSRGSVNHRPGPISEAPPLNRGRCLCRAPVSRCLR